jgi:hypothetical protein
MFGLTALESQLQPESSLDKMFFLVEYVWTHSHRLTTTISFAVLLLLILLRTFKNCFKNTWWIYRLPEVLIVVVLSTCKSCPTAASPRDLKALSRGIRRAAVESERCRDPRFRAYLD